MTQPSKFTVHLQLALLAVALVLPSISLILLGSLWLWQHGYLLYWAIGTCIVVAGVYLLERWLLGPLPVGAPPQIVDDEPGDRSWTQRQEEAWADVKAMAAQVPTDKMTSRDAVLNLGLDAVKLVAGRLHPEHGNPLLQFTLPEALALIERTSGNLRDLIVTTVPFGDRVTVAQLMWLYRWRGAVDVAEKGFQLWRLLRLANPLAAATNEIREGITRQILALGKDRIAAPVASLYVKEVGRAAIDLYGGNLRVTSAQLGTHVTSVTRRDMAMLDKRAAEPIRILVAGETGAGKSSLVNALAGAVHADVDSVPSTKAFTTHKLTREGRPAALIIDSPGLNGPKGIRPLVEQADDCDLILWVTTATRAARESDRAALAAIREHFAAQPNRRRPPMLLVLTQIDRLRPFQEWAPPYDFEAGTGEKVASIRGAVEAVGQELGFARGEVVPVRADTAASAYNIEVVWAKLDVLMPDAQRAWLRRVLTDAGNAPRWATVRSQVGNAGRALRRWLTSGER